MSSEHILKIVKNLLQDTSLDINNKELPSIICSLLRPYVKNKHASISATAKINKLMQEYGICPQCRNDKLKYKTDLFCSHCKSVIKEKAKKVIH